uniref:Uncharacterized protein n=1 Tax=Arundo donax TaxID=35708 RepID=A0A0A9HVF5_ARUDO
MSSSSAASPPSTSAAAADYHCRTKHSLTAGYARGPGRLDWANQPNPFIRFSPAPQIALPNPPAALSSVPYPSLFHSPPQPPPLPPLTVDSPLRAALPLPRALRVEVHRLLHLVASRQPQQRQPAPDRGTHRLPAPVGVRPPRRRPLRAPRPPPGGSRHGARRRLLRDTARAGDGGAGALVGLLAGGVEVRRAGAAVLQPRCGARSRGGGGGRGRAGVGRAAA